MKIINLISFIFLLALLSACSGAKSSNNSNLAEITETKKTSDMGNNEYHELKAGESINSFIDKKVVFNGKISKMPMQHMMRMSPPMGEKEEHEYIEPSDAAKFGQLVAYYLPSKVKWPGQEAGLRFYGTLGSMSGGGKGGGEHTEIYLLLDKVELAK